MTADYNFWQDFFDTYQSLPDWLKFAWLVVPALFMLAVFAIYLRYRAAASLASVRCTNRSARRGCRDTTRVRDALGKLKSRIVDASILGGKMAEFAEHINHNNGYAPLVPASGERAFYTYFPFPRPVSPRPGLGTRSFTTFSGFIRAAFSSVTKRPLPAFRYWV